MVYSPAGSSDLFFFLGCMTSNFLYLSFSTLLSSSLWRTDNIVFAQMYELNKPPGSLTGICGIIIFIVKVCSLSLILKVGDCGTRNGWPDTSVHNEARVKTKAIQ